MARLTGTMGNFGSWRPAPTSGAHKHAPSRAPGRVQRAIAGVARTIGLGLTFALAATGGVLLHAGVPPARRITMTQVNSLLAGTFQGKIVIHRLDSVSLVRLGGIDAEVLDPEGKRVLLAYGADAKLGTWTVLRSLVSGPNLVIDIPEVNIDGVEVVLEDNEAGELGIQRAFESKDPTPPAQETSGGTEVKIPDIRIRHVWAHGRLAAVPIIDADVDDVLASFGSTPDTTDIGVQHLRIRGRGMPGMNPEGALEAHASLPANPDAAMLVNARYEGQVGDIPLRADAAMAGKKVDVVVDVLETMPAAITAIVPDVKLGAAVSAHAEVHGELPVLSPEVRARIGDGEITAAGTVTLPEGAQTDLSATVKAFLRDLDVSLLQEGAPESRLTAGLDASVVSRPGGKLEGTFQLENQVGEVAGQLVPPVSARGDFTEKSVRGVAQIAEYGAPTSVLFSLQPREGGTTPSLLDFTVESTVPNLNAIKRIGPIGRGSAHVVVAGSLDLETKRASAKARGELAAINVQGVQLSSGFVTGAVDGTIENPRIQANVRGGGLRAGGYTFTSVQATASGSPEELNVSAKLIGDENSPHVEARAHISNRDALTVSGAFVRMEREEAAAWARVASIRVADGVVDVRGVTVEGLGAPLEAMARITPGGLKVKAKGEHINLALLAPLLGSERDTQGYVALDVDVATKGRGIEGHVNVDAAALSVRRFLHGGTVHVATALEGDRLRGEIEAGLAQVGNVKISAPEIRLGGPAMESSAWTGATGALAIDGTVALDKLAAALPEGTLPVETAKGVVTIKGNVSRDSAREGPTIALQASTKGLVLVGKQETFKNADGTVTLGPAPWRTEGLDGVVALNIDDATGRTAVSAKLHDRHGPLVSIAAGAKLPLAELMKNTDRLVAYVSTSPIEAKIAVPRRSFDAMPVALGTMPVKGEIELTAELEGTPQKPNVVLDAKATNLLPRTGAPCVRGVDVQTKLTYDGQRADVSAAATREKREFLGVSAILKLDAAQAMAGAALDWEAAGDVRFSRFPLDAAGAFLDQPIAGNVTGKVSLAGLHRDASLQADLDLEDLVFDKSSIPHGKVVVGIKDGAIQATARLDQSDGHMETTVKGAMAWGAELGPAIDEKQPVDIALDAKNFRANAAAPFVRGTLDELDGRIDANAKIHIEPGAKDGHMNGAVAIREGVIQVPQLGERFHSLQGRVVMKPWGTIRFDDFSAKASTGSLTASAQAVVKGLALQDANARITIKQGQSIPISVEGVPMGRAYGDIIAKAKSSDDGKRLDINVDIPVLGVSLPQSTGHSVQPLEPDETIRIGKHVGKEFAILPLDPPEEPREPSDTEIHATIKLGEDVEVRRDTTVLVRANGQANVVVADETRVTGQIRLEGGKLELQGKMFFIDHGTVSFVGDDPADPIIVATAHWDAPDQTRVLIDFSGRVSSGDLKFRSEPALSQEEILSLILFGSRDGGFGADPPRASQVSTGAKAVGMAGSYVTQGVNKAISGITNADIATRVDTSDSSNPRPELSVQISRSVSAKLSYKLGVPAPGQNPDRTELTLEWRFIRNWSLVTVVGDQGSSSFDLVWRRRY